MQNNQQRAPASEVRIPGGQLRTGTGKSDRQEEKVEPRVIEKQMQLPVQRKPVDASPGQAFSVRPVVEKQKENITTRGAVKEEREKPGNEVPVQRSASPFR